MSSHPRKPLLSSARALRPTTPFAMLACAVETWSLCRALVDLAILVSSLRGTWGSVPSQSGVDATRKSLRKTWVRTSTSILLSRIAQPYYSVWAARERFLQQPPALVPWDHVCRGLDPPGNSTPRV